MTIHLNALLTAIIQSIKYPPAFSQTRQRPSIIMKQTTIFVLLVLLLALTADGVKLWKKLSTTTSTKYIVPTTITTTLTVASTCYSPVNVTGGCRRKRDKPTIIDMDEEMPVLFDIDHILPSPPSHRSFFRNILKYLKLIKLCNDKSIFNLFN